MQSSIAPTHSNRMQMEDGHNAIKVVNLERKGERQIQESNLVKFATTFVWMGEDETGGRKDS